MKIIHRYLVKEFLESFFFGLMVFSVILLLDQIFQLVNLLLSKGVSFWIVAKLFALILPNIFSLTIPMAVLLGILLSFGRFSEDNEITALRASGINFPRFTAPILLLTVFLSLFLIYFNQELSPLTHKKFRVLYQDILKQRPLLKFEEKGITTIGEFRLYVEKITKETNTINGISIYKFSNDDMGVPWRLSAASAKVRISSDAVVFYLKKGYWQKPNPTYPAKLIHMRFSNYTFVIPLGADIKPFSHSLKEMNGRAILSEIKDFKQKQIPTFFLENEYWLRYVMAIAPIVFALIAIPLAIITEHGGRAIGFGISLALFFLYYLLLVTGLNISEKGYLHPKIILWLPNFVTVIVAIFLWKRLLKK